MKRRAFIQSVAALILSNYLYPSRKLYAASGETIIVIGAGIAGVACARRLQDTGHTVIVLEARDRVGGRIFTDSSLGVPIDLGASWIHGSNSQHPITQIASAHGIETLSTDALDDITFDRKGREVKRRVLRKANQLFNQAFRSILRAQNQIDRDQGLSKVLSPFVRSIRDEESRQVLHALRWLLKSNITVASGEDPSRLSTAYFDDDEEFTGEEVIFPGGYVQIVNALASGLSIQTSTIVQSVSYGNTEVEVVTDKGNVRGDRVVVTVPLGVLQAGSISFSPTLPDDVQEAISVLAMGTLNKLVLRFPLAFWEEENFIPGFIGNTKPGKGRREEFPEFLNITPAAGEPFLMGFSGGDFARSLESLSNEEIQALAMRSLRRMYGNSIPEPNAILRSSWNSDPFSRGSYSHVPVHGFAEGFEFLSESVSNRLFFAGEATTRVYPGTVHGAYLTGIAQADAISALS